MVLQLIWTMPEPETNQCILHLFPKIRQQPVARKFRYPLHFSFSKHYFCFKGGVPARFCAFFITHRGHEADLGGASLPPSSTTWGLKHHSLRYTVSSVCFLHFVFLFNFLEVFMFYFPLLLGCHRNAKNRRIQWFITISSQSGIKNFINFPASLFCSQGSHIMHEGLPLPWSLDAQFM